MEPGSGDGARDARADACEPKLIVATHVFGNPADAEGLWRLASECGARLMFEAHSYGAIRDGVHVGGLGDVEVFSLSSSMRETCAEGGLVTSRDPEFIARVEYVRGLRGIVRARR